MADEALVRGSEHRAPDDRSPTRSPPTLQPPTTWQRAASAFVAWRSGSPSAMEELVTTMTPVLWHQVRACGLGTAQAEDVVQTTWATLVRRSDSIADPQAVAAWLTTTARREAWRVARSGKQAVLASDELLERVVDDLGSAEEQAVVRDRDQHLWTCVSRLSERCRRLLRIVAFEERPDYAGIARDLKMPVGGIGPTRGRCLAKLRVLLTEGGSR